MHTIGLAEARERAAAARKLRLDGIDPLEARKAEKARKAAEGEAAALMTFRKAAEDYIETTGRMAEEKHAWAVDRDFGGSCLSGDRRRGCVGGQHRPRDQDPNANLDTKAEGIPCPGADRDGVGLLQGPRLARGREPSAVEGAPGQRLAGPGEGSKVEHHARCRGPRSVHSWPSSRKKMASLPWPSGSRF